MHDIWNPWHGCIKCSEGCEHCYMYYLDRTRDKFGGDIYKTKNGFNYPLQRKKDGRYKIQSGEQIRVCMTSDFFLEEADVWRDEAWEMMRRRSDVRFFLLTKRPQRVFDCLPKNWGDSWENIFFNVSCENLRRAAERIPILKQLPFRHKGIMCAPLIGEIDLEPFLGDGQIEQVICGGENYGGARPCNYDWVKKLRRACETHQISFCFIETGSVFIKDGKTYLLEDKRLQSEMAYKSGISYSGKPIVFDLRDSYGNPLPESALYTPHFCENCTQCGSRPICNGCADCGKCSGS